MGVNVPSCADETRIKKRRTPDDNIKKYLSDIGYGYGGDFVSKKIPMTIICPVHGEVKMTLYSLERGSRCKYCWYDKFANGQIGSNNPSWKGGSSPVILALRRCIDDWRYNLFNKNGHICEVTGEHTYDLVVHHMYSFAAIVRASANEVGIPLRENVSDYSSDEWNTLLKCVVKNNELYADPVVMRADVHKAFHMFCGGFQKPTTHEQLDIFKEFIEFFMEKVG